jgi:hypothetical protein
MLISQGPQLESFWRETKIGNVLPWEDIADEAERLLSISKGSRNAAKQGHDDEELENDQEVGRDETHTTRSFLGEGDLILSWSIGATRSFMC